MHSGMRCATCSAMTRGRPPRNSRWCSRSSWCWRPCCSIWAGRPLYRLALKDAAANAARALMVAGNALESGSQAVAQTAAGDGVRIQVRTAGNGFEVIAHCAVVADPWGVVPRTVTGRAHGIWQEES